ncbi:MAG: noncanonical pyrimidine nucleotidase, YjjG family [Ruminococcaceae bacterium]|nr:noncanonical pyrimidine nucleotidase, YjjG family [Oscillospiraceae bacterium]
MYKYLLFDADNTLLDFDLAEREALRETLLLSPLGFSEEIHKRYHVINDLEWKKLERGETTREKLRIDRFANLYREFGMDGELYGSETADIYTGMLSQQGQLIEGAEEVLSRLSKKYDCYIVTNGITEVQKSRMARTPLEKYIKHSFISQEMGCAKPSPLFFEKVFEYIGDGDRSRYLVIGDSLTSDIAGACAVGIDSVWLSFRESSVPTYRIEKLTELFSILD